MPNILLIRHSESTANAQGLMAGGLTDSPLSDEGKNIARHKGRELLKEHFEPSKIFTSTLLRTEQTASIILEELNITQTVTKIPALNERGFGDYDGKPFSLLLEAFDKFGPNPPTIENSSDFVDRVMLGLEEAKKLTTTNSLVVTHVNVLAAIHCALYDKDHLPEFWATYSAGYCEGFIYSY